MSDDNKPPLEDKRRCIAKEHADGLKAVIDKAIGAGDKPVKVAIFSHRCPDPDAIGSMFGLAWVLDRAFGLESHFFYDGEISHPQNIAMTNLLTSEIKPVKEYVAAEYQLRMLCDTIPINAGTGEHKVEFDVVIDHHKDIPNGGFAGLVIHMKTGSCCSIIYKLMEQLCKDSWFEDDNDADSKVATAMIIGIKTDTEEMASDDTTEFEFEAYLGLWTFQNSDFLRRIIFWKLPRSWTDLKAAAVGQAVIDEEGYAIVGLGLISDKDRDLIANMADEMVSWANVVTAIAFAVVGGGRIEGSVRSLNASVSISDFCKKLGGKHGVGGGKLGKGAYRFELAGMSIDPDEEDETKDKTWTLIKEKEAKRITRTIYK